MRILLADDHVVIREGLRALLERRGFNVVAEASDGQEAVRMSERFAPDVAVLDLGMPVMNGVTAAGEIHRVSPKTLIIVLSMHRTQRLHVRSRLS